MSPTDPDPLSRREREILDIVYRLGEAAAPEVRENMPEAPSYSSVRGLLRVLVEKGHLKVRLVDGKNRYKAARSRKTAGKKAMARALETFYGGDLREAVAALLHVSDSGLPAKERERLLAMIEAARQEGR